ncbi:transcriptional regulator [Vibrio sp. SS-MA-C1-2]|uniref:helix-turn-helix transcriptional regulator n=1 Tax=Vibrio sp. SS-MA-C1-2 TaxID=2908646 RepID=UPI001F222803|nr:metalloregulator ArsR/SmtB family transcription factor [Vibrio sp. SS-MA-C1-2]UJF20088.1 transcriptional regulator [Vibrio sp. SS-MA-C1-2]
MKTTDKILAIIKRQGPQTAKMLADSLSITTMGARQHLQSLEKSNLLDAYDVKVKIGRPNRYWQLSTQGHALFIDSHNDLSVQIIESIHENFGPEGLNKIVKQREEKTYQNYKKAMTQCSTLKEKLTAISSLREHDGYMTELSELNENEFLFVENHCPICQAATACQSLCLSELTVFQRLLGKDYRIIREEHIIAGQRRCAYRITTTK